MKNEKQKNCRTKTQKIKNEKPKICKTKNQKLKNQKPKNCKTKNQKPKDCETKNQKKVKRNTVGLDHHTLRSAGQVVIQKSKKQKAKTKMKIPSRN